MAKPKRLPGLRVKEVEEEILIFKPETGEAFLLNPTASAIFELCDGERTVSSIISTILSLVEADPEKVQADVMKALEEMEQKGLIGFVE